MPPSYNLQLVNNSSQSWTFYIYQTFPGMSPNPLVLAWICSYQVPPGVVFPITWFTEYSMVWGQAGQIVPGLVFKAAQVVQAEPQATNTSTFSAQPTPSLSNPVQESPAGSLIIKVDGNVPGGQFAVGIGMSGVPTAIVNAFPNSECIFDVSNPTYWVAASTDSIEVGTVLNPYQSSVNAEVVFPQGVYELTCTLNSNNQWTIQQ